MAFDEKRASVQARATRALADRLQCEIANAGHPEAGMNLHLPNASDPGSDFGVIEGVRINSSGLVVQIRRENGHLYELSLMPTSWYRVMK